MKTIRTFGLAVSVLLLAIAFTSSPKPANAALIQWDFSATFPDASTASGSFVFDSVNTTFSDVSIITTAGTFPALTYSFANPLSGAGFLAAHDPADGPDFTGDPVLRIFPSAPLFFADPSSTLNIARIDTCFNMSCELIEFSDQFVREATLRGTLLSVPEPTSLSILILGLGLLGVWTIRHRTRRA